MKLYKYKSLYLEVKQHREEYSTSILFFNRKKNINF